MDGSHFAKLCRECGLVGGKLTTTAVDIAFSKAKNKARQHVTCKQGPPLQAPLARVPGACLHEVQTVLVALPGRHGRFTALRQSSQE